MMVTDASSCVAWLRAWQGRPRRGVLLACIRGQRARALLLARNHPEGAKAARDVVEILQGVLDRCAEEG